MLAPMSLLLDSFWRAAAYCLHPRVIVLSLLPLILMVVATFGLGYFFWVPALDAVRATLESWEVLTVAVGWLEGAGWSSLKTVLAPLIVVFLVTPVIVVASLLAVAALMSPAMLSLVANRRFPELERKRGGSFITGALLAIGLTVLALLALLLSIPLWLVPPLVLVLPPLIWGWLTYRVLSYDMLADHASVVERRELMTQHRMPLLSMGVLCGYLGAAPSLIWASGVLFVALAPVLVPVAIWIYTLVFAFSTLWFAHYLLAALQQSRESRAPASKPQPVFGDVSVLDAQPMLGPSPGATGRPTSTPGRPAP